MNTSDGQEIKRLLRCARRGALATMDQEFGGPYASLTAVATAADGSPLMLLSNLARHTRNLEADPRVSLLLEDVGMKDPLAGSRVSVIGTVAVTEDGDDRQRYLARQPSAVQFAEFGDFRLWKLRPESAHLVAGFGRIKTVDRRLFVTETAGAEGLLEAEAGAVEHMNTDHADTLQLYATELLGAPAGAWTCQGLDPEGLELAGNGRVLYLPFAKRVADAGQLRHTLKALADQARPVRLHKS